MFYSLSRLIVIL